jgi:hypothetical protein
MGDALRALTGGRCSGPFHRRFVRAQGIHYCGDSQKAIDELDYNVTSMDQMIVDTLQHSCERGHLPDGLGFLEWVTHENAPRVVCLSQIASRHTFARFLMPKLREVYDICSLNDALRQTLDRLLDASEFNCRKACFRFNRAARRNEVATLNKFFDYLYFASDDFLSEAL